MKKYRKNEIIEAEVNIKEDFVIETSWGKQICHKGDYIIHSNNETYPCSKEVF